MVVGTGGIGPMYRAADGVLWATGPKRPPTVFAAPSLARRAVKASLDYSAAHNYGWGADDYLVRPLALPERRLSPSRARLLAAVRWALGEAGEFRPRDDTKDRMVMGGAILSRVGEGPHYWRGELRKRAGL